MSITHQSQLSDNNYWIRFFCLLDINFCNGTLICSTAETFNHSYHPEFYLSNISLFLKVNDSINSEEQNNYLEQLSLRNNVIVFLTTSTQENLFASETTGRPNGALTIFTPSEEPKNIGLGKGLTHLQQHNPRLYGDFSSALNTERQQSYIPADDERSKSSVSIAEIAIIQELKKLQRR